MCEEVLFSETVAARFDIVGACLVGVDHFVCLPGVENLRASAGQMLANGIAMKRSG
ncbi:hypothetical protein [Streptomyces sp. NPDC096132]|uniref:hypothetical protein n=1 Tax=Streptomyces sp. NPDC096132 TaxID=3366075 RepID=UPI00382C7A31